MKFEDIQKVCPLFVKNLNEYVSVYLFGSAARRDKLDAELDEVFGGDIDLLFLVIPERFFDFYEKCYAHSVDFTNGNALDPMDYYWAYHSPKLIRLNAALETLKIDDHSKNEILRAFQGQALDILILPFEWEEDKEILHMINARDPNFSRKMKRDCKLLFSQMA